MLESKQIWRRLKQEGIDEILRRNREVWSRFNLVTAYKSRLEREPEASFNVFLADSGIPESVRYAETEGHNIVLWHATHARHIDNIRQYGFFHHEGVFFAPPTFGLPFGLANAITADDEKNPDELVVFACLFDLEECQEGQHYEPRRHEYRFLGRVSPDVVIAVLRGEEVECVGETVRARDSVTPVKFVRRGREWGIPSRNPYHFHGGSFFSAPEEWLDCYLDFLFDRHEELTLFEILNGIYMNVSPLEVLPSEQVVEALCQKCRFASLRGKHASLKRSDR